MNLLKDSSEIQEATALLDTLIEQTGVVSAVFPERIPKPDGPHPPLKPADVSFAPVSSAVRQGSLPLPASATDEPVFRGDQLENTVLAMCQRGGFSGAVVADDHGLALAIFNSPVSEDALAAFTVVLGDALEKAGNILNQPEANYISMDINYTDKVVLRRFTIDVIQFYMMVICSQDVDERDEVELTIDQIKTILEGA